ncbi:MULTISPECIES: type II secretion system F family protein [unclassified Sphingomonas]|uniref:type II secretion system F family protein n=1 Tax=unclassified Sphingomonas TaxID=196159 RepID=UPI0009277EB4|nr:MULTISPECIES: type II secretion system F family protein [unclassified Sphingomonas]MBN8848193.1 type II secretion system F family protein [Sphingomonas sp.]OJV30684.1 MAG: secretion system protein [Sphingomonas sp. 67-36]
MTDIISTNPSVRLALLATLFVLVVGVALLTLTAISRRATIRGQLRAISQNSAAPGLVESLQRRRDDSWTRLADRIERAGLNLGDTKSSALREKLVAAGFDSPSAPRIYNLIRLVLVIALPLLYVALSTAGGYAVSFTRLYIVGSIVALLGLYVPALVVRAKADRRREEIVNGFPDSLDLMLVCVEAGLGLEAALDRVGRELVMSHPLIAKLFTTTTLQLRAGASREKALRGMAQSSGVEEIGAFATLLIQSDKLGSSISTTLRVYAAEMREKRRMRAEEKAHRIPVLISIPLVACMLPVMIGVLMLPAAVRVIRTIMPAMQGG